MDGMTKLKIGDFNSMLQEWQSDGTVIITLTKRGDKSIYKLHVRDLYLPTEVVLSDEVIEV